MSTITIHPFSVADIPAVDALQQAYAGRCPGATRVPSGAYLSPGFHGGQDVLCAYAGGRLAAYAPVFVQLVDGPTELPHRVWCEVKAHPDAADPREVKELLLARALEHACRAVGNASGLRRGARVMFEYAASETEAIAFVREHGFAYSESVFKMTRDLREPLTATPALPSGISLRRWKMESETEQRAYVAARNECFPEAPLALEDWQYFLYSPVGANGTTIAAFAEDCLVGNTNVYTNLEDDQRAGYTEDIFVRPGWRGQGIASAMILDGLAWLREHGLEQARLAVRAENNAALGLYQRLGFVVSGDSRFYVRDL